MNRLIIILFSIVFCFFLFSCNDDLDNINIPNDSKEETNTDQVTTRLAFNSEEELQSFLDDLNADVLNLKEIAILLIANDKAFQVWSRKDIFLLLFYSLLFVRLQWLFVLLFWVYCKMKLVVWPYGD